MTDKEQGFEAPHRVLDLMFSDPTFGGLKVRIRIASLDDLAVTASLASVDDKQLGDVWLQVQDAFADALVSWNVTRGGRKVPATPKGVKGQDPLFVMELVGAWTTNSGRVVQGDLEAKRAAVVAAAQELREQLEADAELEAGLKVAPL